MKNNRVFITFSEEIIKLMELISNDESNKKTKDNNKTANIRALMIHGLYHLLENFSISNLKEMKIHMNIIRKHAEGFTYQNRIKNFYQKVKGGEKE